MPPGARIVAVQHLRASAALGVVVYHACSRVGEALPEPLMRIAAAGPAGVDLFFVLSGFILQRGLMARRQTPLRFLWGRAARVLPLYWLGTLVIAVLAASGAGYSWVSLEAGHLVRSLALIPHENPAYPGRIWPLLIPGWTLMYEAAFYAIFALAFVLPGRLGPVLVAACLLALVAAGALLPVSSAIAVTYTSPLLAEFALGIALAAARLPRLSRAAGTLVCLAAGLVLVLAAPLAGAGPETGNGWARALLWGVPAAAILWAATHAGQDPAPGPLSRLGDASYAIYITHTIALTVLQAGWARTGLSEQPGAFVVLGVGLSALAGLWIHSRIESPLTRRLGPPPRPVPPRPAEGRETRPR